MPQESPKLYYFVSHRDISIGHTNGQRINFVKGVPTHVRRDMHSVVMDKGIMPCDADGKRLDAPEVFIPDPEKPVVNNGPEDPSERREAIEKAIAALVESNQPVDFAGGTPKDTAVARVLGWPVDKREVRKVWIEVRPQYLAAAA